MTLPALVSEFRQEAEARRSDPERAGAAYAWQRAAERLEEALREELNRVVGITEASRICGHAPSTLRQMIAEGRLRTVSERPYRVRVADLPMKPVAPDTDLVGLSPAQAARVVLGRD